MQDQLIADITGKTLAQIAETHLAGVEGATQRQAWIDAAVADGANYSPTDFAQIMLNARKFNPQTIAEGGSTVNRVDTALYASTEVDSEQYIGPMDGTFTSGDATFSYASDNPNPYKFSIDITEAPAGTNQNDTDYSFVSIFRDADGDGTPELGSYGFKDLDANKAGIQTSYTLNYTSSKLTKNDDGTYTFISSDLASQVGEDPDNYDVVLKYISEADLIAYGATAVEGEVDENDIPVPVGERTFEWGSSIVDKLGHYRSEPDEILMLIRIPVILIII